MATIQVYKLSRDKTKGGLMGSGKGGKAGSTAQINEWTTKAGLVQNANYYLKIGSKEYSDVTCTDVGLPAIFSNVN